MTIRFLLAALALFCATDAAAESWPTKPVTVVVPYPAGGSSDVIARLLGVKLAAVFKQPFVIDNRAGAGTMIGTTHVARAAPDGYTLLIADLPFAVTPSVMPTTPYDPLKDFAAITMVGASPQFLYSAEGQFKSLADMLATARAKPGEVSVASGGNGTASHLMMEMLQRATGVKLLHIPYKGSAPALADAAGGHVNTVFSTLASAAPFVASGKLRVLATTAPERLATMPEVPTFAESGAPDLIVEHWWGYFAPAGTPREIIEALHGALSGAVAAPDIRERFAGLSVDPRASGPESFTKVVETYVRGWTKIAREANVTMD